MKVFRLVLVIMLLITSCKSKKVVVSNAAPTKSMSAKKVSKKHIENLFDKNTIDAKLKVFYHDNKSKQKLSVKLRIDKDKIIWLTAYYKGVVLVARAKITPTSVSYYEKLNKTYFKRDFELLKNLLGADVTFIQLQNLLLGQTIFDLNAQKYKAVVNNDAHLLLPAKQKALFDVLFWINPIHFKLNRQELKNSSKNQLLKIEYKNYSSIEDEMFPKNIEIRSKSKGVFTNIDIEYRSIIFNKKIDTPFRVPRGYKQIVF